MPIYCYKCPNGHMIEVLTHYPRPPRSAKCHFCDKRAKRAIAAEHVNTDCGDHERVSQSMGINPDQIKLAIKTFPGSEYTADGGLKIKNRAHKKVEMARRGYVEFE